MANSTQNDDILSVIYEEHLTCQICLSLFIKPKVLNCLHTFGELCLQEWSRDSKGAIGRHSNVCPTCRSVTGIPPDGISGLPHDHEFNSLFDIYGKYAAQASKSGAGNTGIAGTDDGDVDDDDDEDPGAGNTGIAGTDDGDVDDDDDEDPGQPICTMWAQRYPSLRKSGVGHIFIQNLDKTIDSNSLYDTFSAFGNIVSCTIASDEKRKGYGVVHFETEEAARNAIEKVNGLLLNNKKFGCRKNELLEILGDKAKKYTNVYVKNFGENLDDNSLMTMFEQYGKIVSAKVMFADDGKSKGFGFVRFENAEAAQIAVDHLNGSVVDGRTMYAGRAKNKTERQAELRHSYERSCHRKVNVFVKYLRTNVDDERLRKAFSQFGTITSAKVMREGIYSKGFGFVCFSSREEATEAVAEMRNRIVDIAKPRLYVAFAQTKKQRASHEPIIRNVGGSINGRYF